MRESAVEALQKIRTVIQTKTAVQSSVVQGRIAAEHVLSATRCG